MKIKAKFQLNMLLSIGLVVIIGAILFMTTKQVKQSMQTNNNIDLVLQDTLRLNLMTSDYLLYQQTRTYRQWQMIHDSLLHSLSENEFIDTRAQRLTKNIQLNHTKLKTNFVKVVDSFKSDALTLTSTPQYSAMQERLISHMLVISQVMLTDVQQLSKISKGKVLVAQQKSSWAVMLLVCCLVITIISNSYFLINNIIKPLATLKKGSQIIADGDLQYKIGLDQDNEIGELATAFDNMSKALSETTVSKQYFDNIISTMVNILIVLNPDTTIRTINRAALTILGYEEQELLGQPISKLFEHKQKPLYQQQLKSWIEQAVFSNIDITYLSKTGIPIPVLLSGAVMHDDKGQVQGTVCVAQDMTEHKQLEKRLLHSNKMDALGKLTGGIAHDFNNMLGIILGFCEILEHQLSNEPAKLKYLNNISIAGKRGAELTHKLLAFSKKNHENNNTVNINQLILAQQEILQKSLTVMIEIDLQLEQDLCNINIDSCSFDDTLLNLCINAQHAMPEGGKINIKTANKTLSAPVAQQLELPAGEYITLTIEDNGCGMTAQVKEKIFDPFYTTKGNFGTGLGLSQVYGFVSSSHGAIKVTSEPDVGTVFTLHFPQSAPCERVDIQLPLGKKLLPQSNGKNANKVVLVVDDEQQLSALADEILTEHHFCVYTADNAEQALTLLQNHSIDILLSDVIMPKMNGYQLADKVISQYPDIKVLLSSGYQSDLEKQSLTATTASLEILAKPYTANTLLAAVTRCLEA